MAWRIVVVFSEPAPFKTVNSTTRALNSYPFILKDSMTLDVFKAQAHRLQSFLKSNPELADALAKGKQSVCYDAVAAMHGARNWTTLRAAHSTSGPRSLTSSEFADQISFCPNDDGTFSIGGVRAGEVGFVVGRSGCGKTRGVTSALEQALLHGCSATVLDIGRSYFQLTKAFNGVYAHGNELLIDPATVGVITGKVNVPSIVTFDFEALCLGAREELSETTWRSVDRMLANRIQKNHILVVDESFTLQKALGPKHWLLLDFLSKAKDCGALVLVTAQTPHDVLSLESLKPESWIS